MTEKFDDGTRVHRGPTELHYSLKGGHLLRGLFNRSQREVAMMSGGSYNLFLAPIRVETSWNIRRHMRRISVDGKH